MSLTVDEIDTALATIKWLAEHYEWRAQNDTEHSIVWLCAADVARDLADNLETLANEKDR